MQAKCLEGFPGLLKAKEMPEPAMYSVFHHRAFQNKVEIMKVAQRAEWKIQICSRTRNKYKNELEIVD